MRQRKQADFIKPNYRMKLGFQNLTKILKIKKQNKKEKKECQVISHGFQSIQTNKTSNNTKT